MHVVTVTSWEPLASMSEVLIPMHHIPSLLENCDDTTRWTLLPQHFVKPLYTLREILSCSRYLGHKTPQGCLSRIYNGTNSQRLALLYRRNFGRVLSLEKVQKMGAVGPRDGKGHTGFAITICSSSLLEYWSPWLFNRQHFEHGVTSY